MCFLIKKYDIIQFYWRLNMDQKLDFFLVKKYPEIFEDRYKDMRETCMCWGFDCEDGWFNILNNACNLIQSHIKNIKNDNQRTEKYLKKIENGEKVEDWIKKSYESGNFKILPVPKFKATQIKEKFGTLRFYYEGGDDFIEGIVSMAETMSANTCEVCGGLGELYNEGWLVTRCENHKTKNTGKKIPLKIGDEIYGLSSGKFEKFTILEIINEQELKCKQIEEEILDEIEEDSVREESDKIYLLKLIETKIMNYWNEDGVV